MLRDAIISGANNITNLKSRVDELNVFPVPDGDTGTNMSLTINASLKNLSELPDDCAVDKTASVAAAALLRGARGNSGVILSLLFRGISKGLAGKTEMGSEELANGFSTGVKSAYKAVMKPQEGTILTVARVASEYANEHCHEEDPVTLFEHFIEVAKKTLLETPDLLPVLKEAGVVDSGGQGLVYILEGMQSVFKGNGIIEICAEPEATAASAAEAPAAEEPAELSESYFTSFTVTKDKSSQSAPLKVVLDAIGTDVSLDEDLHTIVCSLTTMRPDKAIREALKHGKLSKIVVENVSEHDGAGAGAAFPYAAPDENVPFGIVSVCAGKGLEKLFLDLGVNAIVSGGQTMNPSTEDILAAIQSIPAKQVLVLANNKNIIMASDQACSMADRPAFTVPTRSVTAGISAMIAFDASAAAEDNVVAMTEAADAVISGSVTFAARDSEFEGKKIKEGSILALENGKPVFTDTSVSKAVIKLAKKICSKGTSFLTVIYGSDVKAAEAEALLEILRARLSSDIEITLVDGGQPVYYYYISAE